MQLSKIIGSATLTNNRALTTEISGLTADSRAVERGFLFAALAGEQVDGGRFIGEAIERGAAAILASPATCTRWRENEAAKNVAFVQDVNPRRRLSLMAAQYFGAQPEHVVAVTGTNGKSSIVGFTRQIWSALNIRGASMGTLGIQGADISEDRRLTTPDPVQIQDNLARLAKSGLTHLAMEASSHGLAQHRLDGVRLRAAAFTNLTQDHLDYHGSEHAYLMAKLRLFGELLPPSGVAVLNADSDVFADVDMLCWARGQTIVAVGAQAPAHGRHLRLQDSEIRSDGQRLSVLWDGREYRVDLPLLGQFQASNALIAAALVLTENVDPSAVFSALGSLQGVEGRLQRIGQTSSGAAVIVDYAHTPDALRNILVAVRPHTAGRLHVVFGAGGDRDRAKRPLMGRIASNYADDVIVTDDNPRSEDAAGIRQQIMAQAKDAREIGDRRSAIELAIGSLAAGDVLVIAGKGHETGQIVGDRTIPFSDIEVARDCLQNLGGTV